MRSCHGISSAKCRICWGSVDGRRKSNIGACSAVFGHGLRWQVRSSKHARDAVTECLCGRRMGNCRKDREHCKDMYIRLTETK